MNDKQQRLIESAQKKHGTIYPCSGQTEWKECFTKEDGQFILWFNNYDNSTHIEKDGIPSA